MSSLSREVGADGTKPPGESPAGTSSSRLQELQSKEPNVATWFIKLNTPDGVQALWLRFTRLVSNHGFKRQSEAWAIYSRRGAKREVQRTAVKQSFEIDAFTVSDREVRIGPCILELPEEGRVGRSRGTIQSKGRTVEWDLTLAVAHPISCNLVPESLQKLGVVRNSADTIGGDLRISGTAMVDGQKTEWTDAAGMLGHVTGPSYPHSWVWGHSNLFSDEKGNAAEFVFEGVTARARLMGPVPSPKLSSLYFLYRGKLHRFNTFWDSIRIRSRHSLTEWKFQADHDELSFRGQASAEHRDFTGLTYEDTNGSFLYCANSKLANLQIHVYRRGKLEAAFYSNGTAALEFVSPHKNPYVPILL